MIQSAVTHVVFGAAGQLGSDLCSKLPGQAIPLTRAELDLTDAAAISRVLGPLRPDVVVNCAAYNFVDRAEEEPEQAFAVNALVPRRLAEVCRELGSILVHFSTDYVFGLDANRQSPYAESDAPGPLSVHGTSKLAGECFVRAIAPRHLVIRTCGLYGRRGSGGKGTNFVETMLRLAEQGKPLRVVTDQICTPSYAVDVADAVVQLLGTNPHGLYHLTNAGQCSWYEFAETIFALSGVRADLRPITSAEYGSRARRPHYSALRSEHPTTPSLRPWREALAAYLDERRRTSCGA